MRVFIINTVCGSGSTGRIVTDLAEMLIGHQHQPMIAYGYGNPNNIEREYTYLVHSKVDYYNHNLSARITDHTGLYSKKATKKLICKIQEFDPDILNLHNIHGYFVNYEILFSYIKEAGIPVLWTLHDCWPFTGHCTHFSMADCYQWQEKCHNCIQLRRYPKCYFKGDVSGNYTRKKEAFTGVKNLTLVTPSGWLTEMVMHSFLRDYPVEIIPNGVDLEIFKPDRKNVKINNIDSDKRLLLGVSSHWNEAKGLKDFIKLSENLDSKYQLVLVGLTDDQIRKMPPSIIALPRTASVHELAAYYATADAFLNLSYEETMGMTTVEAMACGTPVIVYNKTALPETVSEGCGEVVEAGDIDAVRGAINRLAGQKSDRKEALLSKSMLYEKKAQYKKYLDLYQTVINTSGRS